MGASIARISQEERADLWLREALYMMAWWAKAGREADLDWALAFYAVYARRVCAGG